MSKKEIKDPFNKLNEIEQPNTPVQTVVPVSGAKKRKRDNEQSYTLYLNKDILKQLKDIAYHNDTNVKELVQTAILEYLSKK